MTETTIKYGPPLAQSIDPSILMRQSPAMVLGLQRLAEHLPTRAIIIELGSFLGESAEIFLNTGRVQQVYCVDPWKDGYATGDIAANRNNMVEVERAFNARFLDTPPKLGIITKLKATSADALVAFLDGGVDMVYVDACHVYESVKRDIEMYAPKVRRRGIIAGHDWEIQGVARAVQELLGQPDELFCDGSWMKHL